ncbi:BRO family protein, partial [Streptococcus suis]
RSSQQVWFLTEHGLYEVLMRSSKPLAKEFRKYVKQVLKEIRLNGYYMQGELVPHAPQPRISVDAECDYLDRLAQALLDADTRADKLTEIRKMHTFASVMMGKVDFTQYTLSYAQK